MITLRTALEHTQTPRRHGSSDRPMRPLWAERHFADEMPRSRFDERAWDEAKDKMSRGEYPRDNPLRPEHPPQD